MANRASWVHELAPADETAVGPSLVAPQRLASFIDQVGDGPVGWAIELGEGMAGQIVHEIPALGIYVVHTEVQRGCEAVTLAVIAALTGAEVSFEVPSDVLAGPGELVSRGLRIEHMLRSVQVAHSCATTAVLDAVARLVPPDAQFAETRRVSALVFAVVDEVAAVMAREFGKVHAAWTATSAAVRTELVQDILAGEPASLPSASRTLDYDLTREHLALVVWADDVSTLKPGTLERTAAELLSSSGHTSSLILPVGGRRVWAWGSRVRPGPGAAMTGPPRTPGVRVAWAYPARACSPCPRARRRRGRIRAFRRAMLGVHLMAREPRSLTPWNWHAPQS